MPGKKTRILFIGDVVGKPGCRAVALGLASMKQKRRIDLTIVNGENADEGFGITRTVLDVFFKAGADVVTSGNHIWQRDEVMRILEEEPRLIRPANYPKAAPGQGVWTDETRRPGASVVNLQGRVRMWPLDCPFRQGIDIARRLKKRTPIVIVDMHAESTAEKEALALYLDGYVSAVVGTHTHVQTADERILPKGTAYITDVGATAPTSSVIGFDPEISVRRVLTQISYRNEVADRPAAISGVVITVDGESGKALEIERFVEESIV